MGLLSTITGGVSKLAGIPGVSSFLGSALDYGLGRKATDHANDLNIYNAKHQYQWMMQDMRKAGLNPILASKMGPLNIPSAQVNPNSAVAHNSYLKENIGYDSVQKVEQAGKHYFDAELSREQAHFVIEEVKRLRYENVGNKAVAQLYTDAEFLKKLKEIGLSPQVGIGLIKMFLGGKK
jgi:hypothetical protein